MRLALLILWIALLTALTQLGGLVLLVAWGIARMLRPAKRASLTTALFLPLYAATTLFVAPPLATLAGRVPLPCGGEPLRTLPVLCGLNRHYVAPAVYDLAAALAAHLDETFPGTVTLALDGNFPVLDGFPLLPHLSHDDGLKLDLGLFYETPDGNYAPGVTRSPIGYWAFERPAVAEDADCPPTWLTTRWGMEWLQPMLPDLPLDTDRTAAALAWLVTDGQALGLERIFVEPYLASRLGVASPLIGFAGCRAARHDDHIHIQIGS